MYLLALKNTISELQLEKKENERLQRVYEERERILHANLFEQKVKGIFSYSVFSSGILYILTNLLVRKMGLATFTSIIPALSYPAVIGVCSIALGTVLHGKFHNVKKLEENLRVFSKAKKDSEKIRELINCRIELEKLRLKDNILEEIISEIKPSSFETNPVVTSQVQYNHKKNVTVNDVENLYKKLDNVATAKVLSENFDCIRNKNRETRSISIFALISGLILLTSACLSSLMIFDAITPIMPHFYFYIPIEFGSSVGYIYFNKRNSNYTKIFNEVNLELGDDKLSDKYDSSKQVVEETKNLKRNIDTLYKRVIVNRLCLHVNQILEKSNPSSDVKNMAQTPISLEPSLSKDAIIQPLDNDRCITMRRV